MQSIGPRLKAERKRLELSQQQLGGIGGVEVNTQGLYERDLRFPNASYLTNVAKAGVDVLFVITGARKLEPADSITADESKVLDELERLPPEVRNDIKQLITTLFKSDEQK